MSNSYTLHNGDCLDIMPTLAENSVDTIITDPPYGLSFMGKDWDSFGASATQGGDYEHPAPNGYLKKGSRGLTVSQSSKANASYQEFMRVVFAGALRVAKPGAMLLAFGGTRTFHRLAVAIEDAGWEIRDTLMWVYGSGFPKSHQFHKSMNGHGPTWHGYGTALKPAWEPIILAMKPLDGTFAANALEHGVAGLWIDGGRVGAEARPDSAQRKQGPYTSDRTWSTSKTPARKEAKIYIGRWPANLIHDGSDEVTGLMDDAARFFYCAKASRSERNAGLEQSSHHPTVKPLALMRYLAKLTRTPSGGVVLDPFMGSGSTGAACMYEGRDFIGIEQDEEYTEIARRRIEHHRQEAVREQRQPALFEGMNGQQAGI